MLTMCVLLSVVFAAYESCYDQVLTIIIPRAYQAAKQREGMQLM